MTTPGIPALLEPIQERLDAATPEEWRPWPTNPDYEVSDHGNVRSWITRGRESVRPASPRLLKPRYAKGKPYASLSLRHPGGKTATRTIHSVVMETWIGPRPDRLEVAHLNGDPTDNRLVNLQYVTHAENESHKALHGTRATGESVNGAVLPEWQVSEIRYLDSKGVPHVKIGELFGIGHKYVNELAAGNTWTHVDPRKDADEAARLLAAVKAVTELHKPASARIILGLPHSQVDYDVCPKCFDDDGWPVAYPCPTVSAVEAALRGADV